MDSSGNVGIGSATPAVALDVVGAITATSVATATGFAPTASTATGNRLYLPAANTLGLAINGAGEVQLTGTALSPVSSDGNALGTSTLMWSDLFLASGAVINFSNGDVTITHAADNLAVAGGTLTMGTNGGTNGQITFAGSTSGTVAVRAAAAAGTGTIFQLPADNGTDNYVLTTDGNGVTTWESAPAGTPSADSLDFTEFKDAMALDASTSITADGTEVLSIVNTGTGNSFLVEDAASTDTTPFVIDAAGNVGIGSATPAVALDVVGAVTATNVATATGFAPSASTATGNRLYLPAANTLGLAINGAGEVQLTGTALSPVSSDGNALGTSSLMWSDLFLASGGVINFNNGNVTLTHSAGALASNVPLTANSFIPSSSSAPTNGMYLPAANTVGFAANSAGEVQITGTATSPVTSDGNALGTTSLMWSDLFLASGAVINFNNGDVTLTHSADNLAVAGGTVTVGTNGGTNGQVTFNGSTSGSVVVRAAAAAGTATIFELPASNGTSGYYLQTNGSGVTSWAAATASAAGSSQEIQFNNGGSLAANANFVWDTTWETVGIGTDAPLAGLHIYDRGAANGDITEIMLSSPGGAAFGLTIGISNGDYTASIVQYNDSSLDLVTADTQPITFYTDSAPRMIIDEVGDVGIGLNYFPSHALDVDGNFGVEASGYMHFGTTDGSGGYGFRDNSGTPQVKSSGGAWANIATTSDARLKKNIKPVMSALEAITKLQGVTYEWKDPETGVGRKIGLIAQDVEKVYPEAITTYGKEKYRILDYAGLTGAVVEAIKELKQFTDGVAMKVEKLVVQMTGHDTAIKELKAANDNLRLGLKAANDNYASGLKSLREASARQQAEIKELRSLLKAAPAK